MTETADLGGPSGEANIHDSEFSGLRGVRTHASSPGVMKREGLDTFSQLQHLQPQQQRSPRRQSPYVSSAQQQHSGKVSGSVAAATAIAMAAKAAAETAAGTPTARNNSFAAGSEDEDDMDQDEDTDDGQPDGRKRKNGTPLANRAKKPHLQGRFSGRLPTKEDEKRLAEECKLLGPIIGGNGKRGDKSRLTLAKIVRGIASGDIRRYCEERERLLQKVLPGSKQPGGGGTESRAFQQELDMLKKESELKTQRIVYLEKQLSLVQKQSKASSGPGGSLDAPQQHHQNQHQQHQNQNQQSTSPQSLHTQASDYAAQHRQALLMAKACYAQAQALSMEQQQVESSMHGLQVQVNELVQRREELKNEEVVQLQLLDSELSKVQLQAQRHAKALAEMREAGIKAEAQATAYAQSHAQIQQTLDQGGGGGNGGGKPSGVGGGGLYPEVSGGQQLQQHQQHQQCWSLLPTSNSGLDFAPPVRMLEAGSGPSFGPRISLLDPLSTPRISLLDPLGSNPSLALGGGGGGGGGGHSLSGGRISASQLDMRGPTAYYTLNMVPSAGGLNHHRISHLGHQVSPNQNLSLPVFQLGSLRQLGSVGVGMGMDGLGSMQAPGFDTSSAALGALGQSWGQAAAAAVAAATGAGGHLGIVARGSSGSGSTIFGASLPGLAQQQQHHPQQHQYQQHQHQHQQHQQGGVLSLGGGATAGRLQLTGDGLPSGVNAALGLNLALPASRKVEA